MLCLKPLSHLRWLCLLALTLASGCPVTDLERNPELEAHRALVREYHLRAQRTYGFPGLLVLLVTLCPLGVAWSLGELWGPLPWVLAITLFLCGMLMVRAVVRRRIKVLSGELAQYCQANRIDLDALSLYYTKEHVDYPFFDVLVSSGSDALKIECGTE